MSIIEGWKTQYLGSIAHLTMGQSPDSKYYSTDDKKGMPFLQGCAEFKSRFPVPSLFCSQAKKTAKSGSILFSVRAPVGKINIADRDYIIGRGLAAISGVEVDQIYLEHYLSFVEAKFSNASQGSTFEAINSSELNGCPIEYPTSKPEQTKIAEILSTVDRAIEQTGALIAKQQRIKTGLMQDLLTRGIDEHGNLRSEQTHKFKDSSLGRIPVEWEVKLLEKVIEVIDCKHYTPDYVEGGIPIIRPRNIKESGLDFSDIDYVSEDDYTFLTDKHEPKEGDIIFSRNASFGIPVYVEEIGRFSIGQDVVVMTQRSADTRFIFYSLKSQRVVTQIMNSSGGSTFGRIDLGAIRALKVALPKSKNEQHEIAKRLMKCDELIKTTIVELKKLRSLKTALMQDLLTGKKRVTALLNEREVI